ncbi:MAG: DUF1343 domain-containing protein [Elusimicrobia bacterium]|nr:DUF1343 domain-containing protein [Elusimicrobiota bacterium]
MRARPAAVALVLFTALPSAAAAAPSHRHPRPKVLLGIDVLERENFAPLKGKRVGLIANRTSRDGQGRFTAEVLAAAPGVKLVEILALEHGFYLNPKTVLVSSSSIVLGGRSIAVRSLYRGGLSGMRPTPEDLSGVDVLVFDVQDIGVRFYTYLASMAIAMKAAKKAGVEFMVLDRPNPITGSIVEGPILDDLSLRKESPTSFFAVPIRHGLTAGEMARFYNSELKDPQLVVVRMSGWRRSMWFGETGLRWTPPSPNILTPDAALLYSGLGIFESSNLAVGRGTAWPLRWVGAPWFDAAAALKDLRAARLPGVRFVRADTVPTRAARYYAMEPCRGIRFIVTDRDTIRPLDIFLVLNKSVMKHNAADFRWDWLGLKEQMGTGRFRWLLGSKAPLSRIREYFSRQSVAFEKIRRPYLLYR